jgi:glycosyltransferase involved in cell wall biosynthesis
MEAAHLITVDGRMFEASGVGTYLRNILPRVAQLLPDVSFTVLGHKRSLENLKLLSNNFRLIDCRTPVYSPTEHITLPFLTPKDTKVFWSPHFNVPLSYRGTLLVTIHDTFHLAMPQLLGGKVKQLYARALFQAVKRKAAMIISVSEFTRSELQRYLKPCQPVNVIHLGVDEGWFEPIPLGAPHPRPYIIFLGNVKPHKNLAGLLEAFQDIAQANYCDLVIVGKREGFITSDAQVQAKAGALGEHVIFTGWLSDMEVRRYVSHARALVLPSFYEGFGLPPLEAMACGVPTIVSRAASLPEVCGNASLYCDPSDPSTIRSAIESVLQSSTTRTDLIKKGLARAKNFSWAKCAEETAGLIWRLLQE